MLHFNCRYNRSKSKIVSDLADVIESRDGTFEGDEKQGQFTLGKRLGRFAGHYKFEGDEICMHITRKPIYFTNKYIQNIVSAYFKRQLIATEDVRRSSELEVV